MGSLECVGRRCFILFSGFGLEFVSVYIWKFGVIGMRVCDVVWIKF